MLAAEDGREQGDVAPEAAGLNPRQERQRRKHPCYVNGRSA
jgi:hypothetical protein